MEIVNAPELWYPKAGQMSELYPGGRNWFVYRKLKDGKYGLLGSIKWDCNYYYIPIKEKYWKLIYFSSFKV